MIALDSLGYFILLLDSYLHNFAINKLLSGNKTVAKTEGCGVILYMFA